MIKNEQKRILQYNGIDNCGNQSSMQNESKQLDYFVINKIRDLYNFLAFEKKS